SAVDTYRKAARGGLRGRLGQLLKTFDHLCPLMIVGDERPHSGVTGNGGVNSARMDNGKADRTVRHFEFMTQGLGEPAHGELGGRVRGLTGWRDDAKNARQVDDL